MGRVRWISLILDRPWGPRLHALHAKITSLRNHYNIILWLKRIQRGLSFLHQHHIVHRISPVPSYLAPLKRQMTHSIVTLDIKTGNVLVNHLQVLPISLRTKCERHSDVMVTWCLNVRAYLSYSAVSNIEHSDIQMIMNDWGKKL